MRIRDIYRNLDKKTKSVILSIVAVSVALAPATGVLAGYGPTGADRTIYDFSNPAQREGAFDGPRFNSYINTNVYGDERAFLDAKECAVASDACYTQGQAGGYVDKQTVQPGKEYIVRAYVHNIANPALNTRDDDHDGQPDGVARNTRIRLELPQGVANGFTMQARITADNALPQQVYDTVDLKNDQTAFDVEYVPGSARIYNSAFKDGYRLSDNIMTTGVPLGFQPAAGSANLDGKYPGCFEYSSFVVVRVKITTPGLEVQKTVSKLEDPKMGETQESVNVKRGEAVTWRIDYKNTGSTVANKITIRDTIPNGLTLVPGSIKVYDVNRPNGQQLPDSALGSGGVNVGNYDINGNGAIKFRTTVNKDLKECELKNVAFGRAENVSERSDTAKIVIEDCKPTTPPSELPSTGPGDILGIFSATTVAGALAHRYIFGRKRFNA